MILTGPKIEDEIADGRITIDPYDSKLVGPNSVDLRLANELRIYAENVLDMRKMNPVEAFDMEDDGFVLLPNTLYLGRTQEVVGSRYYVPIVEGRSSVGRLGIRVHQTAGFCDLGFEGTITLEIDVLKPVRVYPGVPICQAYFLTPFGEPRLYQGRYQGQRDTTPSRIHTDRR